MSSDHQSLHIMSLITLGVLLRTRPQLQAPKAASSSASGVRELSEKALLYGLHMLKKGGMQIRSGVTPSNQYEQRLLQDVIHPHEAGRGFSEVSDPLVMQLCTMP